MKKSLELRRRLYPRDHFDTFVSTRSFRKKSLEDRWIGSCLYLKKEISCYVHKRPHFPSFISSFLYDCMGQILNQDKNRIRGVQRQLDHSKVLLIIMVSL